jgi:N-acetyl-gamma-glutamyl-phosphate reductase
MAEQLTAGIYGAAGYAGQELVHLLNVHPQVELVFATSNQDAGQPVLGTDLVYVPHDDAPLPEVDVVFLALPHTASAPVAGQAVAAGVKVLDLSADLRMNSADAYKEWYKVLHPFPSLLPVPYGLPEINRANIAGAPLVAVPGCYPTAALLGLYPLLTSHALAESAPIIVDANRASPGRAGRPSPAIIL